jgi:hypothetical protein
MLKIMAACGKDGRSQILRDDNMARWAACATAGRGKVLPSSKPKDTMVSDLKYASDVQSYA